MASGSQNSQPFYTPSHFNKNANQQTKYSIYSPIQNIIKSFLQYFLYNNTTMVSQNSKSLFQSSTIDHIPLTQEEINSFHKVDRTLFTRLVLSLKRDPKESMQVMALLIWFEQGYSKIPNLVYYLLSLPNSIINDIANESLFCLHCIQTNEYPLSLENDELLICTINSMVKPGVTLKFLHDNRFVIFECVMRNVKEICQMAFQDIFQMASMLKEANVMAQMETHNMKMKNQVNESVPIPVMSFPPKNYNPYMFKRPNGTGVFSPITLKNTFHNGDYSYDLISQSKTLNTEIEEALSRANATKKDVNCEQRKVVADDRTIFLTFSKGYIVSEEEVREFFARKFGNIFEDVVMQEVVKDKQPLYARMILLSESTIGVLLGGKYKVKFNINGKHVWGRKYVRKNNKSPQGSSSSSQPNSPTVA